MARRALVTGIGGQDGSYLAELLRAGRSSSSPQGDYVRAM
jgi:GDP-D-mannose dehydratase